MKYILAIDQSTSSSKAILFDAQAKLICRVNEAHQQIYLPQGWVEHDPQKIFQNVVRAMKQVCERADVSLSDVAAIGISNQRETTVVWNRVTGKPIANAVVWQCPRALEICEEMKKQPGCEEAVKHRSGIVLSPYFPAAKVRWLLDHVPGAREAADRGELAFGTMDTWLVYCLTGGRSFKTDYSNASRTQLFNIAEKRWDKELFRLFDIPMNMAAEVCDSNHLYGYTDTGMGLGELPIMGVLGDSHAALFGQNCFEVGMTKTTYGTGSSIMMNIGRKPIESNNGLVTSIAWSENGDVEYVLEGNLNCTGDTLKWLCEDIALVDGVDKIEQVARSIPDNAGVYLVPAFVGFGAPYWRGDARAMICGMQRDTTRAHIARAALESIAYQIKDVTDLMVKESKGQLSELRVDGGPTRNSFLMQLQADLLDCDINVPMIEELSALGAGFMAGIAAGVWRNREEVCKLRESKARYAPVMDKAEVARLYDGWKMAVRRTLLV